MRSSSGHPIRYAARQSGLSTHVIRIWERRYRAIEPGRSGTNRRLYSDADIRRLTLLRKAVESGQNISAIASLSDTGLRKFADTPPIPKRVRPPKEAARAAAPAKAVLRCLDCIDRLDARGLERALVTASIAFHQSTLLERVAAPVIEEVGRRWHDGRLRIANEHMATATLRVFLSRLRDDSDLAAGPGLILTTVGGDNHELGALLAGVTATSVGWDVTHLGTNLPAAEIAAAAISLDVRAVGLSFVYPEWDKRVQDELMVLGSSLPRGIAILAGGRSAGSYQETLRKIGALTFPDLGTLRSGLQKLAGRRPR